MSINEARHHRPAGQVHALHLRQAGRTGIGIGADRNDALALDQQRTGKRRSPRAINHESVVKQDG